MLVSGDDTSFLVVLTLSEIIGPVSVYFKISSGTNILGPDLPLVLKKRLEGAKKRAGEVWPGCISTASVTCMSSGPSRVPFYPSMSDGVRFHMRTLVL